MDLQTSYKSFKLKDFYEETAVNSQWYSFKGYLSTFNNVDLAGDVVLPGAFSKSILENPEVALLLNHDNSTESLVGKIKLLPEDSYGLPIEAKMLKTKKLEEDLIPKIKAGLITSLSIGMRLVKYEANNNKPYSINIIEAKVFEGSIVGIACNSSATFDEFKAKQLENINNIRDLEAFLTKGLLIPKSLSKAIISR